MKAKALINMPGDALAYPKAEARGNTLGVV